MTSSQRYSSLTDEVSTMGQSLLEADNFSRALRQSTPGRSRSQRITAARIFFSDSSASSQELVKIRSHCPRAENIDRDFLSRSSGAIARTGILSPDSLRHQFTKRAIIATRQPGNRAAPFESDNHTW